MGKLHAYYLHCKTRSPGSSCHNATRPNWFSYSGCFKNFICTMKDTNLNLVIDGPNTCDSFIDNNEYRKIYLNGPSGYPVAWSMLINTIYEDCLSNAIKDGDLIYIVEDDYIHNYNWYESVIYIFENEGVLKNSYVTLYDHPDKYIANFQPNKQIIKEKYSIILGRHVHWRQTPNGCGNFIVSKGVFMDDIDTIKINDDGSRCNSLNMKGRMYYSPIPSLSTHIHPPFIAPIIDWVSVMRNTTNE